MTTTTRPGDAMLHPAPLLALALLIVNDHVLKGLAVGTPFDVVTGKLSDVAGLAMFPVLLVSLVEIFTRRAPASRRVVVFCVALTALVFALTKTWTPMADAYRHAIALLQSPVRGAVNVDNVRHVMDATDLIALPATALAFVLMRNQSRANS